jgi:hypothetical protein
LTVLCQRSILSVHVSNNQPDHVSERIYGYLVEPVCASL